jgi:hypothetical protein
VIQSYKYLSMRMRNDMCVDSFVLRMFEKQTIDDQEEEEDKKPSSLPLPPSLVSSSAGTIVEAAEERSNNIASSSPQKESLLVQISNRVKLLEKNATTAGSFLRQLNASLLHQAADMDHILEAVIRAKETFKDSLSEQVTVRSRLKLLTERLHQFEALVEESSQTVKLLMATLIVMAGGGLYLVCSLLGRSAFEASCEKTLVVKKEIGTMTEPVPAASTASSLKKVVFNTSQDVLTNSGLGGSYIRGGSRPSRRVTWCGGVEGRAAIVDDSAAVRHHEELPVQLEEEILKSILKKAARRALSLDTAVGGSDSAACRRRVTWCGGYLSRHTDQLPGKSWDI